MEDYSKYSHSPAHLAVAQRDHAALKKLIATLPRLAKAGAVNTEDESVAAELDAYAVSAVIDCRDVPGREMPLHLAVRIKDPISADIFMAAGAALPASCVDEMVSEASAYCRVGMSLYLT
ncbi:putative ankyrin repeat domain-containing protein [Helianthus annuus]|nr:putative ankyrin repeat domain-containing protein [Helianthus annuus]